MSNSKSFDASKFVESPYLKAAEMDRRRPVRVTVAAVDLREFQDQGEKPVLKFLELEKSLVVNKTQIRTLIEFFGSDTGAWVGQRILLRQVTSNYQGKPTIEITEAEPTAPGSKAIGLPAEHEVEAADIPF